MPDPDLSATKVWRIWIVWRVVFWAMAMVSGLMAVGIAVEGLASDNFDPRWIALPLAMIAGWLTWVLVSAAGMKLSVSPDGIRVRDTFPSNSGYVSWNELRAIWPTKSGLAIERKDGTGLIAGALAKSTLVFMSAKRSVAPGVVKEIAQRASIATGKPPKHFIGPPPGHR